MLAVGVSGCGVRDECDAAVGLLPEQLEGDNSTDVKACAALGLGLAYCGAQNTDAVDALLPIVSDTRYGFCVGMHHLCRLFYAPAVL